MLDSMTAMKKAADVLIVPAESVGDPGRLRSLFGFRPAEMHIAL
jgi:hypothetical protein